MPDIRNYGRTNRTVSIFGDGIGSGVVMITYPTIDNAAVGHSSEGEMIASATGRTGGEVVVTTLPGSAADKTLGRRAKEFASGEYDFGEGITLTDEIKGSGGETITCTGGVFIRSSVGIEIAEGVPSNTEYAFEFQKIERDFR